mgnify:CR=1 FL=1
MLEVKPKYQPERNKWRIKCHNNLLDMSCICCLQTKFNIGLKELEESQINDDRRWDGSHTFMFNTKEDAEHFCDFIDQHIMMKKLSGEWTD